MRITCDPCELDFDDRYNLRYCPHQAIPEVTDYEPIPVRRTSPPCVHPYNKVYTDDTDGRVICIACNEVLVDTSPGLEEVSEWHKEGPNPTLLGEGAPPQGGHAVGWDGCPCCFGCAGCTAVNGDCCVDCTYASVFHSSPLPYGGTAVGNTYDNQVCNCKGHTCTKEE